jgi:hypothetical protein
VTTHLSSIVFKTNNQDWATILYKDGIEHGVMFGYKTRYLAECCRLSWELLFYYPKGGSNPCDKQYTNHSVNGYDEGMNNYNSSQSLNLNGKELSAYKIGYRFGKEKALLLSFYKD